MTELPWWPNVLRALEAGHRNRAEAAKKLGVRKASLISVLRPFPNGWGYHPLEAVSCSGREMPFPKESLGNAGPRCHRSVSLEGS